VTNVVGSKLKIIDLVHVQVAMTRQLASCNHLIRFTLHGDGAVRIHNCRPTDNTLSTYPVSGRIAPLQLFIYCYCSADSNSPIGIVNTVVMCGAIDSISSSPFPLEIDMCPHALVCILLHYDCTWIPIVHDM